MTGSALRRLQELAGVLRRGCALVVCERRRRRIWRAACQSAINTAAAQHRHAVDDEPVPEQLRELAGGLGALQCAISMDDQGAVAVVEEVVEVKATVRTAAHELLVPAPILITRY
jgi:hypothetical protein